MSGYTLQNIKDATRNISTLNLPLNPDDLILFIKTRECSFRAVYEDLAITHRDSETLTLTWYSRGQTFNAVVVNPQNPTAYLSIPYETFILVTGKALESLYKSAKVPVAA